jgi:LacI family transcriptional regulator
VALLIETSNSYGRGLLEGIVDYVREHEPWSMYLPEQGRGDRPPSWLRSFRGDGIIARIENPTVARHVAAARLPTIDVSAARLLPALPWLETDDAAIADLGFQHLAERGFRHFAFCGDPAFGWSKGRGAHFERLVRAAGHAFHRYEIPRRRGQQASWDRTRADLGAWIEHLPRPTGVLACYDIMAQQILDACRDRDVAVPEEIAVVGVDNDELLCRLADPPLTSIAPDTRRTGYEAAALLDGLMRGDAVSTDARLLPPRGVVTRQSTDVIAVSDPHVADALRFIREHATDGIGVSDVVGRSRLSRRMLESRFRKVVGRTPHEELLRTKMARVKVLLAETDLSIAEIAERTGYEHIEYLSAQFHRITGTPPSHYRAQHRR